MNKKALAGLYIMAVVVLLASCAKLRLESTTATNSTPAPTQAECAALPTRPSDTPAPAETESEAVYRSGTEGKTALSLVPDWSDFHSYTVASDPDVPDFFTSDQQDLFRAAKRMYDGFEGCSAGYDKDYSVTIEIPRAGKDWSDSYLLDNGFASFQDFITALHAVFTDAFCEELLHPDETCALMIEHEGKLYSLYADRGSDLEYLSTSYTLESRGEDRISFFMVGHYNETAYDSQTPDPSKDYTREYPIQMEYTEHGWRFSSFAIPY